MLDAPVSGGVKGATNASLTIMVGGDEEVFNNTKKLLKIMGVNIIYAGQKSTGQIAKICNNMILGISMIGVSEAFNLGTKLGIAPEKLFAIVSKGSGECWSLTKYCPYPNVLPDVPSSNNYKPGFTVKMMLKDLNLSQDASISANIGTPMGNLARDLYQKFDKSTSEEIDFSGIIKFLNHQEKN
jgi:3-hydroxyisobutyrate dehydrogenase